MYQLTLNKRKYSGTDSKKLNNWKEKERERDWIRCTDRISSFFRWHETLSTVQLYRTPSRYESIA